MNIRSINSPAFRGVDVRYHWKMSDEQLKKSELLQDIMEYNKDYNAAMDKNIDLIISPKGYDKLEITYKDNDYNRLVRACDYSAAKLKPLKAVISCDEVNINSLHKPNNKICKIGRDLGRIAKKKDPVYRDLF